MTSDCRHWLRGNCRLNTECRFSHDQAKRGAGESAGNYGPGGSGYPSSFLKPLGQAGGAPGGPFNYGFGGFQQGSPPMGYDFQAQPFGHYPSPYYGYPPQGMGQGMMPPQMFAMRPDTRKPCRHWLRGSCQRGDACGFAHPSESQGPPLQPAAMPMGGMLGSGIIGGGMPGRPLNYRTIECRHWANGSGSCRMGNDCSYKHTLTAAVTGTKRAADSDLFSSEEKVARVSETQPGE